jgi:hypothetical protein
MWVIKKKKTIGLSKVTSKYCNKYKCDTSYTYVYINNTIVITYTNIDECKNNKTIKLFKNNQLKKYKS